MITCRKHAELSRTTRLDLPGSLAQDWVPFGVGRTVVSRGFVPICPKKSSKMRVEFRFQMCKKEVVKILGSLHGCKFNMQKG